MFMLIRRSVGWGVVAIAALWCGRLPALEPSAADTATSSPLRLHYRAEWRLIHAGDVKLVLTPPASDEQQSWQGELELRTRGPVNKIYKVDNHYSVLFDSSFCAQSSLLRVHERKKRRRISVTFQQPPGTASYLERDLVKDVVVNSKEIDVPACVHDELAALQRLRTMRLEPGETIQLPVSNGKKSASVRVDVQKRESIKTPSGVYQTIRCEAFLYDNVLYRRKARLFIWLTDDERRLPVQIRVRMSFYIGTITLQLAKEETT